MASNAATKKQAPQLASNIEGFDNSLRLLIAVAARAAANLQLPQDTSLPSADISSITQNLAAFKLEEEPTHKAGQHAANAPSSKACADNDGEEVGEVDAKEVQEAAQAINAAAAAQDAPQLSPEELRREREKLKASIDKVEAANAAAARLRKTQALQWADEVARHCKFGEHSFPSASCLKLINIL